MWLFPSEILQSVTLDVESIRQHQVFNSFFINHQVKVRSRSGDCKVSHTRWKLKTFKHLKGIPRRTSRGIQGGYTRILFMQDKACSVCDWTDYLYLITSGAKLLWSRRKVYILMLNIIFFFLFPSLLYYSDNWTKVIISDITFSQS